MKKTAPGLTDYASALATPKDIMDYPEEYEYFMQNKQGTREPGIEMIPGLDILHLTELRDYGLLTIRKLAEANSVPVHLKAAQDAAIRIQATLAKENESGKEENTSKEIEQEVPATDRSSDTGHIGQPAVSSSEGNRSREVGEGLRSGGPIHNSQGIDNWSVSFRM